MLNLMWTWQEAVAIAGLFAVAWGVLKWRDAAPRVRPFVFEAGLVIALYGLWQVVGAYAGQGDYTAVTRGQWIWNTERTLLLPSERTVQHWVLPHPLIVQIADWYYALMHFTVLIMFLIWMFTWHRERYSRWRTALALLTAGCLFIQFLPVAPPRMVAGTGIVDTAVLYHQSVYSSTGGFDADQLSAMPSVHIGWAVFVAIAVWSVTGSPWLRGLTVAHAVLTVLVVVVTGNHYWADGIVACLLLGLAIALERALDLLWRRAATRRKASANSVLVSTARR